MIDPKAKCHRTVAAHFYETPVSEHQTIEDLDADHVIFTATVRDTAQLQWRLRGFAMRWICKDRQN